MAYNTKAVIKDVDGNPISQYFNPTTDEYEYVEGSHGGNKVVVYNEDGTESNVNLLTIVQKLEQLTGTVIDEETRKSNEVIRKQNEVIRVGNEDVRLSNEATRESSEGTRVLNEIDRVDKELIREQNRIIVEGWIANPSQFNGKDIEYNWRGTELGVRVAGNPTYSYVDLKGETGSIDSLDSTHIQTALGFLPKNYIAGENVTIEDNVINAEGSVKSVNGETGDVVVTLPESIIQSITAPTGTEEGRLWLDLDEIEIEPTFVNQVNDKVTQVEINLGTHLVDDVTIKHKAKEIGLESVNFTATNTEDGMDELFTSVSNGKQLVGNAITDVDDSVVIPTEPSFGDLASAISGISTGKKWASGTATSDSNRVFFMQYPGYQGSQHYSVVVDSLDFKPSFIFFYHTRPGNYFMGTVYMEGMDLYDTTSDNQSILMFDGSVKSSAYYVDGVVASIVLGSFKLPHRNANETVNWIAFE